MTHPYTPPVEQDPGPCECGHSPYDHDERDDYCDLCDCDEYEADHA